MGTLVNIGNYVPAGTCAKVHECQFYCVVVFNGMGATEIKAVERDRVVEKKLFWFAELV
jgi:hypothetical protein